MRGFGQSSLFHYLLSLFHHFGLFPKIFSFLFQIFTERFAEIPLSVHEEIIEYLSHISLPLEIGYLENAVEEWKVDAPSIHDRLILNYVHVLMPQLTGEAPENETSTQYVWSLNKFLKTSTKYRADRILPLFPQDGMPIVLQHYNSFKIELYFLALLRERTILLSRLGRHSEALTILAESLRDVNLAEEYVLISLPLCKQSYSSQILLHTLLPYRSVNQRPILYPLLHHTAGFWGRC